MSPRVSAAQYVSTLVFAEKYGHELHCHYKNVNVINHFQMERSCSPCIALSLERFDPHFCGSLQYVSTIFGVPVFLPGHTWREMICWNAYQFWYLMRLHRVRSQLAGCIVVLRYQVTCTRKLLLYRKERSKLYNKTCIESVCKIELHRTLKKELPIVCSYILFRYNSLYTI
jgi:hypothetical protein